jgi:hypothetical protein
VFLFARWHDHENQQLADGPRRARYAAAGFCASLPMTPMRSLRAHSVAFAARLRARHRVE